MRDRQYVSSLAVSAAVLALSLAVLVSLPLWLGWGGVVGLAMIVGGFLLWFYRGRRPDLQAMDGSGGGHRSDHE